MSDSFPFVTSGTIRALRPSDRPRFRDHLLRLDAESRRDRFNGYVDDAFIRSYVARSFAEGATVIGYVEGDLVLGAAELHERADKAEPAAEIAFSVEKALQHRGIGGRLFDRLIGQARGLGYAALLVTTHPGNLAMRALARRFHAQLRFEDGETVGTIQLAAAVGDPRSSFDGSASSSPAPEAGDAAAPVGMTRAAARLSPRWP